MAKKKIESIKAEIKTYVADERKLAWELYQRPIKEAKIEDASIKSSIASIKVKFSSEQVQVIKNDKGKSIYI